MKMKVEQVKVKSAMNLPTIEAIAEYLGQEYPVAKVESIVCTMARKGFIEMKRAKSLLEGRPIAKVLDIPFSCNMRMRTK